MESQLKSLNVLLGEQVNTIQSPLPEMKHHETPKVQVSPVMNEINKTNQPKKIQPDSESKEEKNLLYPINR